MSVKVSVVVPTYNRANDLKLAMQSILNQTFSDLELVISDDCSTDHTQQIVESFADPRVRYYRNETNLGLVRNWEKCVGYACGDFVALYQDHDIPFPYAVEKSLHALEKHPSAVFVHAANLTINDEFDIVGCGIHPANYPELMDGFDFRRRMTDSWLDHMLSTTTMVRREAYESVPPFGVYHDRYGSYNDSFMWFNLAELGNIAYIREPLFFFRARAEGHQFSQVNWPAMYGRFRMRADHIRRLYKGTDSLRSKTLFVLERHQMVLMYAVRTALLESPEKGRKTARYLRSQGDYAEALAIWLLILGRPVRRVLNSTLLERHYSRAVRQAEAFTRQADEYVKSHPEVLGYLSLYKLNRVVTNGAREI